MYWDNEIDRDVPTHATKYPRPQGRTKKFVSCNSPVIHWNENLHKW